MTAYDGTSSFDGVVTDINQSSHYLEIKNLSGGGTTVFTPAHVTTFAGQAGGVDIFNKGAGYMTAKVGERLTYNSGTLTHTVTQKDKDGKHS